MTQTEALRQIRALGLTARVRDGEFRINVPGGDEETAYYTDDRDDAVATAKAIAAPHFTMEVSHAPTH